MKKHPEPTVRHWSRNGKPIEDLSKVEIDLADYPPIVAALMKPGKDTGAA